MHHQPVKHFGRQLIEDTLDGLDGACHVSLGGGVAPAPGRVAALLGCLELGEGFLVGVMGDYCLARVANSLGGYYLSRVDCPRVVGT